MTHSIRRRRTLTALAASGALAGALIAGSGGGAKAKVVDESPSTPITMNTPDGQVFAYLLNAKHQNLGQTNQVERAVTKAGGVVVQSWPQIGVVVAHSTNGDFREDVVAAGKKAVGSVGSVRSVPVSEGTPDEVDTPWSRSVAPAKKGARKPASRPGALEATRAVVADPDEALQWDMQMIKADQAHAITDGSRDVLVGVLDSGIDADHPDLAANIDVANSVNCSDAGRPDGSATGWQPTTSDHGTHVAGTIGAARNGVGLVGVAPGVRMASVKVVNDDGFIYPEYAVCGFMWAGLHGMDVTNNSYYIDPFYFWCGDQPDQAAGKEAVRRAVDWATSEGVVHAAAAGNESLDLANKTTDATSPDDLPAGQQVDRKVNSGCHDIPTELDGVATVSSMQQFPAGTLDSRLSGFSNRGLGTIDVAAPGSSILSTIVTDNGYGRKSGTSMASPHVAGVLALMKSVHPGWAPDRLLAKLREQADDKACGTATAGPVWVGPVAENSYFGDGVVDALEAVS